ncbi:TolC family protein [Dehalobacter sp. DCM]|uniref:TolC family protein n=1 Tax=Dehalobacter sp. DCM TaxID=2907827 RepID=UPI003081A528|nr:TolC family protein [Dehalobacter sp. DCM]
MKYRILSALLAILLVFPFGVLAETTPNITTLEFSKIESAMRSYNPTVIALSSSYSKASNAMDDTQLKNMQTVLGGQIAQVNDTLDDATIDYTATPYTVTAVRSRYVVYDAANKCYLYQSGAGWTVINPTTVITAPQLTGIAADDASRNMDYQNYLLAMNYQSQLATISSSISSLTTQKNDLWKTAIQLEQNTDRVITMAESAYLGYFTILKNKNKYENNLAMLQANLKVMRLQESYGMVAKSKVAPLEVQVKELTATVTGLSSQLTACKQQINILLGQDMNTAITLTEITPVEASVLNGINYESDLTSAVAQSFDVRLASGDYIQYEDAKRSFTLAFQNAFKDIQTKREALSLQQDKLVVAKKSYDVMTLKYKLGMVSKMTLDSERYAYLAQQDEVKAAERDVLQSVTTYNWLKKGYKA